MKLTYRKPGPFSMPAGERTNTLWIAAGGLILVTLIQQPWAQPDNWALVAVAATLAALMAAAGLFGHRAVATLAVGIFATAAPWGDFSIGGILFLAWAFYLAFKTSQDSKAQQMAKRAALQMNDAEAPPPEAKAEAPPPKAPPQPVRPTKRGGRAAKREEKAKARRASGRVTPKGTRPHNYRG